VPFFSPTTTSGELIIPRQRAGTICRRQSRAVGVGDRGANGGSSRIPDVVIKRSVFSTEIHISVASPTATAVGFGDFRRD
jgi:hypothetical protein